VQQAALTSPYFAMANGLLGVPPEQAQAMANGLLGVPPAQVQAMANGLLGVPPQQAQVPELLENDLSDSGIVAEDNEALTGKRPRRRRRPANQPFDQPVGSQKPSVSDATRYWCCFHLSQAYTGLGVVPCIIGRKGTNTKRIFEMTGAKIRVRGRGSGHKEATTGLEAPAGLMVTVSSNSNDWNGFVAAVKETAQLLELVQQKMNDEHDDCVKKCGRLCWQITTHDNDNYRLVSGVLIPEAGSKQLEFRADPGPSATRRGQAKSGKAKLQEGAQDHADRLLSNLLREGA